jgi:hypothetical protein
MRTSRANLFATTVAAVLLGGCGTSPPGAGFTNGEKPTIAEEKPGVRDDLQAPSPDSGDAKLAGSAANVPDPGATPPPESAKPKPATIDESQPK